MPSTAWHLTVGSLVAVVLAYSVVVAAQPLLGVFLATGIYAVAWLLTMASPPGGFRSQLSSTRATVTGILVVVVLLYSLLVAGQVLLGVIVATFVVLVSWLTSPQGPVAAWLAGDSGGDGPADP